MYLNMFIFRYVYLHIYIYIFIYKLAANDPRPIEPQTTTNRLATSHDSKLHMSGTFLRLLIWLRLLVCRDLVTPGGQELFGGTGQQRSHSTKSRAVEEYKNEERGSPTHRTPSIR